MRPASSWVVVPQLNPLDSIIDAPLNNIYDVIGNHIIPSIGSIFQKLEAPLNFVQPTIYVRASTTSVLLKYYELALYYFSSMRMRWVIGLLALAIGPRYCKVDKIDTTFNIRGWTGWVPMAWIIRCVE